MSAVLRGPEIDALGVLRHDGESMPLSHTEQAIMRVLVAGVGQPVARTDLAAAAWPDGGPHLRAIDIHVHRLRPRLRAVGLAVHTLRGRGFMLESLGGPAATRRI